jgi:Protein of unknown function (DUF664)
VANLDSRKANLISHACQPTTRDADSGGYLRALWAEGVNRSRAVVQAQLGSGEEAALSGTHVIPEDAWEGQVRVSLRWVLVHMIEEYARHLGHADLIRESIDGQTGD